MLFDFLISILWLWFCEIAATMEGCLNFTFSLYWLTSHYKVDVKRSVEHFVFIYLKHSQHIEMKSSSPLAVMYWRCLFSFSQWLSAKLHFSFLFFLTATNNFSKQNKAALRQQHVPGSALHLRAHIHPLNLPAAVKLSSESLHSEPYNCEEMHFVHYSSDWIYSIWNMTEMSTNNFLIRHRD